MSDIVAADASLYTVKETVRIALPDGNRLAARIWLPKLDRPVPAVLEFLPYRRRDVTSPRDDSTYPAFASNGIAGVRVDMRGTGDSDGLFDDEYSHQELGDAESVIAWIASQSWCNGNVGMMGISWGGFNSLQVAARRPPALRAVISIASTVDRIADDIHYKGGVQLSAQLHWATTMLSCISRPPDAAVVGETWFETWQARLAAIEPLIHTWLRHQRRDDYWKHGSIREDFSALQAPAWVIAGWADGYRNTPWLAAEGLGDTCRATTGPWIHKYPHFACPHPRLDFTTKAIQWWRHWMDGGGEGVDSWPAHALYLATAVRPAPRREADPGRWVRLEQPGDPTAITLALGRGGRLVSGAGNAGAIDIATRQDCGVSGGEFFTVNCASDLPRDQSADDALSVCFETDPLDQDLAIVGRPTLTAAVSVDQPIGMLVARLIDVHPDGVAHRVSLGVLNLTHRNGSEMPTPMTPGSLETITLHLDVTAYCFRPGHRVRLALSTTCFPMLLPVARAATVRLDGDMARLSLPTPGLVDIDLPMPGIAEPLPRYPAHTPGHDARTLHRDDATGRVTVEIVADSGVVEQPDNGMIWRESRRGSWSIHPDDPCSLHGTETLGFMRRRDGVETRGEAVGEIRVSASHWIVRSRLITWLDGEEVFSRSWSDRIPRDLM